MTLCLARSTGPQPPSFRERPLRCQTDLFRSWLPPHPSRVILGKSSHRLNVLLHVCQMDQTCLLKTSSFLSFVHIFRWGPRTNLACISYLLLPNKLPQTLSALQETLISTLFLWVRNSGASLQSWRSLGVGTGSEQLHSLTTALSSRQAADPLLLKTDPTERLTITQFMNHP